MARIERADSEFRAVEAFGRAGGFARRRAEAERRDEDRDGSLRAHSTLPGFYHPVGIERRLDLAHRRQGPGVLQSGEKVALEPAHAVLGGIRAAEARDDGVHDLVHRLPAIEEGLAVGADRLRHVEMDVAVAEMAEGDDARAGREGFDRGRRLLDQGGHEADRDRDVVLDRGALLALRLGQALAQTPKRRPLIERGGDRGVLNDVLIERRLESARQGFVEPARRLGGRLHENVPVVPAAQRRARAAVAERDVVSVAANQLKARNRGAEALARYSQKLQRVLGTSKTDEGRRPRARVGKEPERSGGDDAQRPLGADEQALHVVAGVVLAQLAQRR